MLTHPRSRFLCLDTGGPYDLIPLNIFNLRHLPDPFNYTISEHPRIALDMPVVHMSNARLDTAVKVKRVRFMSHSQEVEMVLHDGGGHVVLEHHEIRVVDRAMGVGCRHERGKRERGTLLGNIVRRGGKWV
jgi:hypothetical protein